MAAMKVSTKAATMVELMVRSKADKTVVKKVDLMVAKTVGKMVERWGFLLAELMVVQMADQMVE